VAQYCHYALDLSAGGLCWFSLRWLRARPAYGNAQGKSQQNAEQEFGGLPHPKLFKTAHTANSPSVPLSEQNFPVASGTKDNAAGMRY